MTDPFSPPGITFTPVSRALTKAKLVVAMIWLSALALVIGAAGFFVSRFFYYLLIVVGVLAVWLLLLIPWEVRNLQYAVTDDDLYVRSGPMFRRLDQVPYGRIQTVELKQGPVSRRYGIATIHVSTASTGTHAHLPGIPRDEAIELRALLVDRAPTFSPGL